MNLLKDYIDWARKQMKREETPSPAEQKVQDIAPTVYVDISGQEQKPKRKPRKKTNDQA
jgi:hypothetical protein